MTVRVRNTYTAVPQTVYYGSITQACVYICLLIVPTSICTERDRRLVFCVGGLCDVELEETPIDLVWLLCCRRLPICD